MAQGFRDYLQVEIHMILGRLEINGELVKIMVDFEIHLKFGGLVG